MASESVEFSTFYFSWFGWIRVRLAVMPVSPSARPPVTSRILIAFSGPINQFLKAQPTQRRSSSILPFFPILPITESTCRLPFNTAPSAISGCVKIKRERHPTSQLGFHAKPLLLTHSHAFLDFRFREKKAVAVKGEARPFLCR